MKKVLSIFLLPIQVLIIAYKILTRKCFYVTGTFIDKNGTRMFCKTVFYTYGNLLPIMSLEKAMAKQFNTEKVIIIFFNRISLRMAKHIETNYDDKIILETL